MYSIIIEVDPREHDNLIAELWEAGTLGVTERDTVLRAFFDDPPDPHTILERFAQFKPAIEQEEQRDWVKESQDRWQPFPVGERFYLVPEWRDDPAPCGRIRLRTRPGMACGTGDHPATQLCLRAMERHIQEGSAVLDVGTGTGILAEAAVLLGAGTVIACDLDIDVTLVAKANLARSIRRIPVFVGSVRAVTSQAFDLVVANLNAATLSTIRADLIRILKPGAKLLVAGFRAYEAPEIMTTFALTVEDTLEQDDWACLLFRTSAAMS